MAMLPVAIVGTGPAGLMAATKLATSGVSVVLIDKRRGPGRKLVIAGKSGLNLTNSADWKTFHTHYVAPRRFMRPVLDSFTREDWLKFISDLGFGTFAGSGGKIFIDGLRSTPLLRAWLKKLTHLGVELRYGHELCGLTPKKSGIQLEFAQHSPEIFSAVILALGGGSWERESPLRWPQIFSRLGVRFNDFTPANVGLKVDWPKSLLAEAEGLPLKNVILKTRRGQKQGEMVVTAYGLEGGPIYDVGVAGPATLDLYPELSVEKILGKLTNVRENLSPLRRAKKNLHLGTAAQALLFYMAQREDLKNVHALSRTIKNFPILLGDPMGLRRAISSAGGVDLQELDSYLMLKKHPGIFVAGEMLDWSAPTGGFLIQACVSMGALTAEGVLQRMGTCKLK